MLPKKCGEERRGDPWPTKFRWSIAHAGATLSTDGRALVHVHFVACCHLRIPAIAFDEAMSVPRRSQVFEQPPWLPMSTMPARSSVLGPSSSHHVASCAGNSPGQGGRLHGVSFFSLASRSAPAAPAETWSAPR